MMEEQEETNKIFEDEQAEEIRARYEIMLKYFHDMTAKLQELKKENKELKLKLAKVKKK